MEPRLQAMHEKMPKVAQKKPVVWGRSGFRRDQENQEEVPTSRLPHNRPARSTTMPKCKMQEARMRERAEKEEPRAELVPMAAAVERFL